MLQEMFLHSRCSQLFMISRVTTVSRIHRNGSDFYVSRVDSYILIIQYQLSILESTRKLAKYH